MIGSVPSRLAAVVAFGGEMCALGGYGIRPCMGQADLRTGRGGFAVFVRCFVCCFAEYFVKIAKIVDFAVRNIVGLHCWNGVVYSCLLYRRWLR